MAALPYRLSFWIGTCLLGLCVGLGLMESLRETGAPPPLPGGATVLSARDFYGTDDPEAWAANMRAYTEVQPHNPEAWLVLCKAERDAQQLAPAIVACKRAIALGDATGHGHLLLARIYSDANRPQLALRHARAASQRGLRLPPDLRRALAAAEAS